MSTALVTGATGLVGSHIVDRLMADGWTVRVLARSPEDARRALPKQLDIRRGDVLDAGSFADAARGCSAIFHTAANIIVSGGWESYQSTNVGGTRNAIEAAASAGARLIQLSSVAVYGPSARYDAARRGERTDEDSPLASLHPRAYYARSKRESEELVMAAHREGRIWATAVRPDVIYGPRDRQFTPRIAKLMRRLVVPLIHGGRTTMAIVHAANVADGAVRAATNDMAGGRAYNLANDYDVTVRQFFDWAGEGLGMRPRYVPMPLWLATGALSTAKNVLKKLSGGRFSLVSNSAISFIAEDNPFSSDRARRELGWDPPVRPEQGVRDAFRWVRDQGK